MNKTNFHFETPRNGWMSIHVHDASNKIFLTVSDVPTDALHSLVTAINLILKGSASEEVEWSLEPDYAIWKFTADINTLTLDCYPKKQKPEYARFTGRKKNLLQRLVTSLSRLEKEAFQPDAKTRHWSWEFPTMQLDTARNLLKEALPE